ncbi:hypothetical protein M422DRAFT_32925 [Sphaerobolus stellatus SS14]|uniref:Uncharacterized protein n=1 Tax=Sphaerobolus stellatus (strain SS14) TaxID=990650 RepID=A0A0C9U7U4_SPHS4|nr:hypothetical protein M422DRAFT_32925 [Sphaerobolus stellatus SS14]
MSLHRRTDTNARCTVHGALLLRYVYSFLCPGLFSSHPISVLGPCSIVNNPSPFHAQNLISTYQAQIKSNQTSNVSFRSSKSQVQVSGFRFKSNIISYHLQFHFRFHFQSLSSPLLSTIFRLNLSIDSSDSSTQPSIPFQAGTESTIESQSLIIVEVWFVGWCVNRTYVYVGLPFSPYRTVILDTSLASAMAPTATPTPPSASHHTTPPPRIRIEPHTPRQKGPIYQPTNQPPTERTKTK